MFDLTKLKELEAMHEKNCAASEAARVAYNESLKALREERERLAAAGYGAPLPLGSNVSVWKRTKYGNGCEKKSFAGARLWHFVGGL